MAYHPFNLFVRFLLEVAALISLGIWAWNTFNDWQGWVMAILLPLGMAVIWGVFAVPGDPSRSGYAPVPINGILRLAIELLFFGCMVWALYDLGWHGTALVLGLITLIHYLVSYERVGWLINPN